MASKSLVDHALGRFSTDNLSCMVVRFNNQAIKALRTDASIGVEGDKGTGKGGISEADAIVEEARKHAQDPESIKEEDEGDVNISKGEDIKLNPEAPKAAVKNQS
jgi:protein phosphatase PTC1